MRVFLRYYDMRVKIFSITYSLWSAPVKMASLLPILIAVMLCFVHFPLLTASESHSPDKIDYASFSRKFADETIEKLNKRAWHCVEQERYDSAAAYYSVAASRFSESLPLEDKRRCAVANLNLGYVWLSWRMNAPEAYPRLMKAREIARQYGFHDIESYVLSNLGQIYFDYNNPAKGADLHREALKQIMKAGKDRYFGQNLIDYTSAALSSDRIDSLIKDVDEIARYRHSDKVELYEYSNRLVSALRAFSAVDDAKGASIMESAEPLFDLSVESDRYLSLHHLIAARMWMLAGEDEKALTQLHKMVEMASKAGYYNLMEKGYAYMVECCRRLGLVDSMNLYQSRAVHIRDSLFNASRFEIVKDLEVSNELHDLHENIRKATSDAEMQRQRMLWIGLTSVLLLIAVIVLLAWHRRLRRAYKEIFKRNMELSNMRPQYVAPETEAGRQNPDEEQAREILAKVVEVMESSNDVYDPDFTVDRLSALTGYRSKQVSHAINMVAGKNFNALLAEYRVREACRILADPESLRLSTMECVAEKVGYKSRTYFSKVFKNITGLTPTQFARQSK